MRARVAIVFSVAAALLAAGCGVGAGDAPQTPQLLVTRDFGAQTVLDRPRPRVGGSDTVMRLLERNAGEVRTRFGGKFVQSIDGLSGGVRGGRQHDWFFYVNGVEASQGAASVRVHDGDRVWWDHHDWDTAMRVPAVVGSFPEPFVHGVEGKRLPVRVECAVERDAPCNAVRDALLALDVPAARGALARSYLQETLRVLVGRWDALRADTTANLLDGGPENTGVFARPARDGRSIALMDQRGRTTRVLRAGAGLVAALRVEGAQPVWIVTGTDDAGVAAAARAFNEGTLSGRFAVALDGADALPLPDAGRP